MLPSKERHIISKIPPNILTFRQSRYKFGSKMMKRGSAFANQTHVPSFIFKSSSVITAPEFISDPLYPCCQNGEANGNHNLSVKLVQSSGNDNRHASLQISRYRYKALAQSITGTATKQQVHQVSHCFQNQLGNLPSLSHKW